MPNRKHKPLRQIVAENLRVLRLVAHVSQEELAELCGLHSTYISDIVKSETAPMQENFNMELMIFCWFVYSKSAIFKAIRNQVTNTGQSYIASHNRHTSTAGWQGAVRSWTSEKEGKQAAGFLKSKDTETAWRSTT